MKPSKLRPVLAAMMLAVALFGAGAALAQDYPNRPIRIVNPYAPGGSTDPVLRPMIQRMSELLGQAVFIENKPGAGTNIGSEIVAKSKPDGYTLLLGTSSLASSPSLYKKLNYDPVKDLQPVALLVYAPFTLAVNASLPVKSVQELIDYAHANPGKLNYGSAGNGGAIHLGTELFKSMTKTDIVHVPFKGSGEVINALLGGDIQVALSPATNFVQHAKAGRVRMLAVASSRRVDGLDLPTFADVGRPLFVSGVWMALFAPVGTPKEIIDKLNGAVNIALKERNIVETYQRIGMVVEGGSAEDLGRLYLQEVERWPKIVKEAGLVLD